MYINTPAATSLSTECRHKQIYSVEHVSLKTTAAQQVRLSITGTTNSKGWSQFILVPSTTHRSTALYHHYDAWGVPPTGVAAPVIELVTFEHILPAGEYIATIHAETGHFSIDTATAPVG